MDFTLHPPKDSPVNQFACIISGDGLFNPLARYLAEGRVITSLTFDIFDDALAGRLFARSHLSLHNDEDEPKASLSLAQNLRHRR